MTVFTVPTDMSFCGLFIASDPQNLFGHLDWYIKWLGLIDRLYPAWCSDLRYPPPFSVATPTLPMECDGR